MTNVQTNNVASTNGLTHEQDKQRLVEIERLIERLKVEQDLRTKKAIRHALRMRGHFGGLNERRSYVRSIIAGIVSGETPATQPATPATPDVAPAAKPAKKAKKAK